MTLVRSNKLSVIHPGLIFRKRILEAHRISISNIAKKMHISRLHLHHFLTAKVGVTAPFALKLEKATGISAGFWMNLQATYDLSTNRNLDVVRN